MKLAILATTLVLATPAFAASQPAMQSGKVTLNLLSSENAQGCDNDVGILALNPEDIPTPVIYGGTMTGAWGKHLVEVDVYADQGLLDETGFGCQSAEATLCTGPDDALGLTMVGMVTICGAKATDANRFNVSGGFQVIQVNGAGIDNAWGSATGTIEPFESGVTRLRLKVDGVVESE